MAVRKRSPKKKAAKKAPAKPRDRGGRPRKAFGPEQIADVASLGRVLTQDQLAAWFGIDPVTLRAIMERQPEVSHAYKKARAEVIGKVANNLVQMALEGDVAASIFFLKTQARWTERHDVRIEADATADAARGKLAALLRLEPDEAEDEGE
jgi:hypothetical protein